MVKRRANLTGLSRFLQEAFGEQGDDTASSNRPDNHADGNTPAPGHVEVRPFKKRKTGLLGPGHEKYDASELVPFYTHASEVPEHLQKCMIFRLSLCYLFSYNVFSLFATIALFFAIFIWVLARRRRMV